MGHIDIECLIYRQSIKMKFVVAFWHALLLPKPLLLMRHHTNTGALIPSMCCPEATTATDSISTMLGAPVLTTETFSLNSQRALFQRVVKTKRKLTTVSMKWSKSSLKPEPKSKWNLCFHKVTGSKPLRNERLLRRHFQGLLPPCLQRIHLQHARRKMQGLQC